MNSAGFTTIKQVFCAFALTSSLLINFGAPAQARQAAAQSSGQLLRKSADMSAEKLTTAKVGRPRILIRLQGLQSADLVNIRPSDSGRVEVAAGTLIKDVRLQSSSLPIATMQPGPPLPDSAVEVKSDIVSFVRQAPRNSIVFVDIQVPRRALVRVEVDGEMILKSSLRQPLALRNREWGQGASTSSGAIMQAVVPPVSDRLSNNPVSRDGTYYVPSSRLKIIQRSVIRGEAGQRVIAKVDIDETGQVVKVTPLTDNSPSALEETLKSWKFTPYEIAGRPVRVSTTLVLTIE